MVKLCMKMNLKHYRISECRITVMRVQIEQPLTLLPSIHASVDDDDVYAANDLSKILHSNQFDLATC